jgi:hypothetical protein
MRQSRSKKTGIKQFDGSHHVFKCAVTGGMEYAKKLTTARTDPHWPNNQRIQA